MPKQRCPCGAVYTFPDSAVGKRAKCVKCGATLTLRSQEDQGPIAIAGDDSARTAGDGVAADRTVAGSVVTAPESVAPAFAPPEPIIEPSSTEPSIGEQPPRGYLGSVFSALLFVRTGHNLIMFLVLWILLFVASAFLPWAGLVGVAGRLMVFAWFAAFKLNLIVEAATGETQLPGITLADGAWDGMVVPFVRWVGSWLIVLAPTLVTLVVLDVLGRLPVGIGPSEAVEMGPLNLLLSGSPELMAVGALYGGALLAWPMTLLCVALGGFGSFGRPDMIVETVWRTLPEYLLTALIVVGLSAVIDRCSAGSGGTILPDSYLARHAAATGIEAYLGVVAMSAIGLYYYHFRDRFAWSWG